MQITKKMKTTDLFENGKVRYTSELLSSFYCVPEPVEVIPWIKFCERHAKLAKGRVVIENNLAWVERGER